jgi:hypothetical protein
VIRLLNGAWPEKNDVNEFQPEELGLKEYIKKLLLKTELLSFVTFYFIRQYSGRLCMDMDNSFLLAVTTGLTNNIHFASVKRMAIGADGSIILRAFCQHQQNPLTIRNMTDRAGVSVLWAFCYVSSFLLGAGTMAQQLISFTIIVSVPFTGTLCSRASHYGRRRARPSPNGGMVDSCINDMSFVFYKSDGFRGCLAASSIRTSSFAYRFLFVSVVLCTKR